MLIHDKAVPGVDIARAGPDDEINAFDDQRDVGDRGTGNDYVRYDRNLDEIVASCDRRDPLD
jgi:hypothetical protein